MVNVFLKCSNNSDFCGSSDILFDFKNEGELVNMQPAGGTDGRKSFKNMICIWDVKFLNKVKDSYSFDLFYTMLKVIILLDYPILCIKN